MPEIYPLITLKELEEGSKQTREGTGVVPLPGVKTDALQVDPEGAYKKNRQLAQMISDAVTKHKITDKVGGPRFLLAWRLYPNKENPYWHHVPVHACSCGCGGNSGQPHPRPEKKKKKKKAPPKRAARRRR